MKSYQEQLIKTLRSREGEIETGEGRNPHFDNE